MPDTKGELNVVERVIALEAVDLFRGLTAEQLSRIATIAREIHYPPERTVLAANEPVDSVYVVLDGDIEMRRDGRTVHTAKRGEVLGSWALFDPAPIKVEARAATDAKLLKIGRSEFHDLLSDNMQIVSAIFATLVRRLRQLAGD